MIYIKDFALGMTISGIYLCSDISPATKKSGQPYSIITLMDKTGSIKLKDWDMPPEKLLFKTGDYVIVDNASVSEYNSTLELKKGPGLMHAALPGTYAEDDYIPVSERDFRSLKNDLADLIDSVSDRDYRMLLRSFFVGDTDLMIKFNTHYAATSNHQNYKYGLLEHTVNVASICKKLSPMYPFVNQDLVITAALLHDIGKVRELAEYPEVDYTTEGSLLGHIVIGIIMVEDKIKQIPDFPEEKKIELEHCIVAHHGKKEWDSPEVPKMVEPMLLHLADMIDSRMMAADRHFRTSKPDENGWYPRLNSFEGKKVKISEGIDQKKSDQT